MTFDDPNLVANAGLILVATLAGRLGLEALINTTVRLAGRAGGALAGRKVLTLVHTIAAGGSHIDHADVLRAGATASVLGHRVMAPSTLGTFLGSFTFGHLRQLDRVIAETIRRAWALGAGPGDERLVIDVDSTITEVAGKAKQGAGYGYTKRFGYHPILATRAETGEVLHARMRKGAANTQRGAGRFIEELIGDAVTLDAFHRHHAVVELAIRDLKEGAGLEHVPSGQFFANGAWLACAVLAHNLIRWTAALGDVTEPGRLTVARTMRTRLLALPARLVNRSGTHTLSCPLNWPWADQFTRALQALRALPPVPI